MDLQTNIAETIIGTMKELHQPSVTHVAHGDLDECSIIIMPNGMKAQSVKPFLEEYREKPQRRKGTAVLADLRSFIAHTQRFQANNTAIFANANEDAPSLTTIFDYHPSGPEHENALWSQHRAHYPMPLSTAWKAWRDIDGAPLTQKEFAKFLEENAMHMTVAPFQVHTLPEDDLIRIAGEDGARQYGSPADMRQVARGLRINVNTDITSMVDEDNGTASMGFAQKATTRTADGEKELKVPTLFLLNLPVFDAGAAYPLPVRLRYEHEDKKATWTLQRFRADLVFRLAFDDAAAEAAKATGLPIYAGKPEGNG